LIRVVYTENSDVEELVAEFNNVIQQIEKEQPEIIQEFRNWINNFLGNYDIEINNEILETQKESEIFAASVEKLRIRERTEGKLEIVQQVLIEKVELKFIEKITGLPINKILEIKEELDNLNN